MLGSANQSASLTVEGKLLHYFFTGSVFILWLFDGYLIRVIPTFVFSSFKEPL